MQVSRGVDIGEPSDVRHEPVKQIDKPVRPAHKARDQVLTLVHRRRRRREAVIRCDCIDKSLVYQRGH